MFISWDIYAKKWWIMWQTAKRCWISSYILFISQPLICFANDVPIYVGTFKVFKFGLRRFPILFRVLQAIHKGGQRNYKTSMTSVGFTLNLFAFFTIFSFGSDQSRLNIDMAICKTLAAVMYTLLLSVIIWTIARSLQYYRVYVLFFDPQKEEKLKTVFFGKKALAVSLSKNKARKNVVRRRYVIFWYSFSSGRYNCFILWFSWWWIWRIF